MQRKSFLSISGICNICSFLNPYMHSVYDLRLFSCQVQLQVQEIVLLKEAKTDRFTLSCRLWIHFKNLKERLYVRITKVISTFCITVSRWPSIRWNLVNCKITMKQLKWLIVALKRIVYS